MNKIIAAVNHKDLKIFVFVKTNNEQEARVEAKGYVRKELGLTFEPTGVLQKVGYCIVVSNFLEEEYNKLFLE